MQKPISQRKIDDKVTQITSTYKQLQKAEDYIIKKTLISTLRKLCLEGLEIVDSQKLTPENIRKKKQIEDMLKKCNQIETKIDESQKNTPSIGCGGRLYKLQDRNSDQIKKQTEMSKQQLMLKSRQVAKSIIFHEISSQNMKITTEELDELAKRMQTNKQVMKQIEFMVYEQGGDIHKIEEQIEFTYSMAKTANVELEKAADQQHQNRMLKIRLGVSGFLGAFGMKILGLPGLLFGFISGMIATR